MKEKAIIFLAHGSKNPEGNNTFDILVEKASKMLDARWITSIFFRSALSSSLHEIASQLYKKGCRHMHLVPAFFLKGKHVSIDLPEAIITIKTNYPDIIITQSDILSSHPKIIDILTDLANTDK